jgi:hypothetical protein
MLENRVLAEQSEDISCAAYIVGLLLASLIISAEREDVVLNFHYYQKSIYVLYNYKKIMDG